MLSIIRVMYDSNKLQIWLYYSDDHMMAYSLTPEFIQLIAKELEPNVWSVIQLSINSPFTWVTVKGDCNGRVT